MGLTRLVDETFKRHRSIPVQEAPSNEELAQFIEGIRKELFGYPQPGSMVERVFAEGLMENVTYAEIGDPTNVLTPEEFAQLRDVLLITGNEGSLVYPQPWGINYDRLFRATRGDSYKTSRNLSKVHNKISASFWTSVGEGVAEGQELEFPSLHPIRARIARVEEGRVIPDYATAERELKGKNNDFISRNLKTFSPLAYIAEDRTSQALANYCPPGDRPRREDFRIRDPSYRMHALICLNRDGNNPGFPEGINALTKQIFEEYVADPEQMAKSEWVGANDRKRFLDILGKEMITGKRGKGKWQSHFGFAVGNQHATLTYNMTDEAYKRIKENLWVDSQERIYLITDLEHDADGQMRWMPFLVEKREDGGPRIKL